MNGHRGCAGPIGWEGGGEEGGGDGDAGGSARVEGAGGVRPGLWVVREGEWAGVLRKRKEGVSDRSPLQNERGVVGNNPPPGAFVG